MRNSYIDILYTDRRRIYPDGSIKGLDFDPTNRPPVIGRKPDAIGKNTQFFDLFNSRRELSCISLLEEKGIKLIGTYHMCIIYG